MPETRQTKSMTLGVFFGVILGLHVVYALDNWERRSLACTATECRISTNDGPFRAAQCWKKGGRHGCDLECDGAVKDSVIAKHPSTLRQCVRFYTYNTSRNGTEWWLWRDAKVLFLKTSPAMVSDQDIQTLSKGVEELKLTQGSIIPLLRKLQDDNERFHMEIDELRKANAAVHNAVYLLEEEKVNLRKAVHKLKLRNTIMQRKMNTMKEKVKEIVKDDGDSSDDDLDFIDYDDIGRDFILVGGINDPLAFGYKVALIDEQEKEHKSAERYYWYLMAEYFNDQDAMAEIRTSPTFSGAETAMKAIKNFDEKKWDKEKLEIYAKANQFKFAQSRYIRNILVSTRSSYIAMSSDDKLFGTGWRKTREEATKPLTWDGLNEGGRLLMKIRKQALRKHTWEDRQEEAEMENRVRDLRRFVWRRIDTNKKATGYSNKKSLGKNM